MKNDLTCGVVEDLLPSFVEGLTSDETNRAVEAHVADCPTCAAKLAAMRGPETEATPEVVPEVDYLKKVKKRTGRKVLLAVLCTVAVIVLGIAAKVFIIGEPADPETMAYRVEVLNDTLHLDVTTFSSGKAYWGWLVEYDEQENNQVVRINAREGLASPLHNSGSKILGIPLNDLREIYLCGRLVWQDGEVIDRNILRLYETRTPYAGDASALGQIAAALDIQNLMGSYTMELQTSERPYDWTLRFPHKVTSLTETLLPYQGPQMLALVDNLDQVTWACPSSEYGHTHSRTLTVEAVNAHLPVWFDAYNETHNTGWTTPDSVKDCADSAASFQKLLSVLQYRQETRRMGVDDTALLQ